MPEERRGTAQRGRRKACIVVCDDEAAARRGVMRALGQDEYDFVECRDGRECLEALTRPRARADLVLLDLRMPGIDGMAALGQIVSLPAAPAPPPVIVVTADASLRSAIAAVKAGAADYLAKPYDIEELRLVVQRTLETARLRRENLWLAEEVRQLAGSRRLIGESAAMRAVMEDVERVAPAAATVLILGESGTGKELVARSIHELSARGGSPLVTLNCAAIPDTLVESELFGHLRGAFTGADRDRAGKFRQADGGTLFLDEVGDLSLAAQAKLLRTLQEGVVEPLGGGRPVEVDVRVLAATHRDLKAMAADGRFREDLLFRLRVVEVRLPALRERGDDVVQLARHFLAHNAGAGRTPRHPARLNLSPAAERLLLAYAWPGNVRELANAIERAAIFCRGDLIQPADLPTDLRTGAGPGEAPAAGMIDWPRGADFQTAKAEVVDRFERAYLAAALREHAGNLSRTAASLGIHRQSLQQKLRKLGLQANLFRSG
ncbi:MAG TPA: sigma-54 dependent transcriptional regulator [Thermoanaerobaculia bacterium]|nr:sigma-54 dependent transcriptional regulator [Thermoanaerobaculia bacterium]